jgi:hypothetical protein
VPESLKPLQMLPPLFNASAFHHRDSADLCPALVGSDSPHSSPDHHQEATCLVSAEQAAEQE